MPPKGWKKNPLVADALREDGEPEIDVDESDDTEDAPEPEPLAIPHVRVEEPPAPVAVAPDMSRPVTMTAADLQQMITAAVTAAVGASGAAMASVGDAVRQGIEQSRAPIPENKIHHHISSFNPLGDTAHPRPGLKCAIALGVQDAKTKQVYETYPFEADDLTAWEQIALNLLEPVHAKVSRLDGVVMPVSVVPEHDPVNERLTKLTVVIPTDVTAQGSQVKNMLPGVVDLVRQITGKDVSRLAGDELAWVMAEHRAGRYVAAREVVAA